MTTKNWLFICNLFIGKRGRKQVMTGRDVGVVRHLVMRNGPRKGADGIQVGRGGSVPTNPHLEEASKAKK